MSLNFGILFQSRDSIPKILLKNLIVKYFFEQSANEKSSTSMLLTKLNHSWFDLESVLDFKFKFSLLTFLRPVPCLMRLRWATKAEEHWVRENISTPIYVQFYYMYQRFATKSSGVLSDLDTRLEHWQSENENPARKKTVVDWHVCC